MMKSFLLITTISLVSSFAPLLQRARHVSSLGSFLDVDDAPNPAIAKTPPIDREALNPEENFKEWFTRKPIVKRRNLSGNLIISGNQIMDQSRPNGENDQPHILYMLTEEQYEFRFNKVYVLCDDAEKTRRSMLSRKARYSGLLDKIDFVSVEKPYSEVGNLCYVPTPQQVADLGISNWILMQDEDHALMGDAAHDLATKTTGTLKNIVMTCYKYDQDLSDSSSLARWDSLGANRHRKNDLMDIEKYTANDVTFTLLALGEPCDGPDGGDFWNILPFNGLEESYNALGDTVPENEDEVVKAIKQISKSSQIAFTDPEVFKGTLFSNVQAHRLTLDALQLAHFEGRAYAMFEVAYPPHRRVFDDHFNLLKRMQEMRLSSPEILDQLTKQDIVAEYYAGIQRHKNSLKSNEDWWHAPLFAISRDEYRDFLKTGTFPDTESRKEKEIKQEEQRRPILSAKEEAIVTIAHELVRREYFREHIRGSLDEEMTEDKYESEKWDWAVQEAIKRYERVNNVNHKNPFELRRSVAVQKLETVYLKRAEKMINQIYQEKEEPPPPTTAPEKVLLGKEIEKETVTVEADKGKAKKDDEKDE